MAQAGALASILGRRRQRQIARGALGLQLGPGGNTSGERLRGGGFGLGARAAEALTRTDLSDEQKNAIRATAREGFLPTHAEMRRQKRMLREPITTGGHEDRTAMLTGGPKPASAIGETPGKPVNVPSVAAVQSDFTVPTGSVLAELMRRYGRR